MTRRTLVVLIILVVIVGGAIGLVSLRPPPDGRVRIEIVAPWIAITAPDGITTENRLSLDFAPWLDVGVESPPGLWHAAEQPSITREFLPRLYPGFHEVEQFGKITAECGLDRRYTLDLTPMTIENEAGERREIVLVAARGVNTSSRACSIELTAPTGKTIERRGTELRPPSRLERWFGSPQRLLRVEFALVEE